MFSGSNEAKKGQGGNLSGNLPAPPAAEGAELGIAKVATFAALAAG